jgi:hypothetical protein
MTPKGEITWMTLIGSYYMSYWRKFNDNSENIKIISLFKNVIWPRNFGLTVQNLNISKSWHIPNIIFQLFRHVILFGLCCNKKKVLKTFEVYQQIFSTYIFIRNYRSIMYLKVAREQKSPCEISKCWQFFDP